MTAPDGRARSRTVRFSQPVNARLTLSGLRRGPGDPTHRVVDGLLWRTSRMPSGAATWVVRQVSPEIVDVQAWGSGASELLDGMHRHLGGEDDPTSFAPGHPVLVDSHRRFPGLRVPHTGLVLESLIAAVIEQKVVGLDAFAAWRRLLLSLGEPAPGPAPDGMRVFPTAEQWAAVPSWGWHLAGVDPRRAHTAQSCARVGSQLERLAAAHPDEPDAVYRGLRSIPGVGVWTAAEVGARALGDTDAVSFGDYHLAHLVGTALTGERIDDQEMADVLEPWRPHRQRVIRLLGLSPFARIERRGARMSRVDHRRI